MFRTKLVENLRDRETSGHPLTNITTPDEAVNRTRTERPQMAGTLSGYFYRAFTLIHSSLRSRPSSPGTVSRWARPKWLFAIYFFPSIPKQNVSFESEGLKQYSPGGSFCAGDNL